MPLEAMPGCADRVAPCGMRSPVWSTVQCFAGGLPAGVESAGLCVRICVCVVWGASVQSTTQLEYPQERRGPFD